MRTVGQKNHPHCKVVASLCFAMRKTPPPATRKLAAGFDGEKEKSHGRKGRE